jgi:DNA-binding response OmpR family regulator
MRQDEHVSHVLIVEDNDLVSGALRVLFEQTGRRVSVAATVADAIAVASADRPDLMLIDLTLPDGNGLAILEELRREKRAPRVAVALTGHDDPAIAERCAELGCADVLLKPVPTRELLRRAEQWLA